ncbi:molybdopterin-guanine dinucleotide biosynthesis protein B [Metabacillus schmidteae]|uniref:molybdopterin-guanine dinucleotide biosynthesis protein B n=1 Tax=Metabacillus schmidteae TaxID=2730405 RepID=UPI00158ADE01|nr:molybdopterin-guanine dinucleotide biosynthesis protein B [Metabacillus schmidteae]
MGRILQVVGYQNSGKTTFVTDYIKEAVRYNLKVGTIKHHGHGGALVQTDHGKDTEKHREAGARVTLVDGNESFILSSNKIRLTLSQMISMYGEFGLDVILIEGYKLEKYPKVVLLRSNEDLPMLEKAINIICVVAGFSLPVEIKDKYPTFLTKEQCIKWLLMNEVGEYVDNANV